MSATVLHRETFSTSRLLDFASEKELVAQTGHQRDAWPVVILKELIDNAIDGAEEAGIAPVITVKVDDAGITVEDNGPGIPPKVVESILDFSVRVSSREAYVSPTRGAQGNALKTLVCMPFVLDGGCGRVEIEAQGVCHRIQFSVDRIGQKPVLTHHGGGGRTSGTRVTIVWPAGSRPSLAQQLEEHLIEPLAGVRVRGLPSTDSPWSILEWAKTQFLQIACQYLWLNPHLTLSVDWLGARVVNGNATDLAWSKWNPSDPTSPHWYDRERFERLICAYLTHDANNGRRRLVRELVAEFRGLSGTAKQKAILEATSLWRAPLTDLVNGNAVDRLALDRLLTAMKAHSKPVKPRLLGSIGREHFKARFATAGCEMESFNYKRVMDTTDDIPWIVETAFGWCPKAKSRWLVCGVNWSPGIVNPFRELGRFGKSLDTVLSQQRVDHDEPVILVLHMACPRVEYTDRGKSAVVVRS